VLGLAGPAARDVLAKGCGLDLHPSAFAPGRCAQTLLAQAQIVLEQRSDEPEYHLFVRPSFARYLREWLRQAMHEFD
jgi:sarcosine oxidase subunit gamma